jgi:hypothetical protein
MDLAQQIRRLRSRRKIRGVLRAECHNASKRREAPCLVVRHVCCRVVMLLDADGIIRFFLSGIHPLS